MILTITPNPALDVSYRVGHLVPGESHRVQVTGRRAGGKGINVAAVAATLGHEVLALAPFGGPAGEEASADLRHRALTHRVVAAPGTTRTTVSLYNEADDLTTQLNEPGPQWDRQSWRALTDAVVAEFGRSRPRVVVVSGSLPPGAEPDALLRVLEAGSSASDWLLDASGPHLLTALAAVPLIVKPNLAELISTFPALGVADTARATFIGAQLLQDQGARLVIISDGPRGVIAVPPKGTGYRVWLPNPLRGNATGAGDALTAALAAAADDGAELLSGAHAGADLPQVLRFAVAVAAAALYSPIAGDIDPDLVPALYSDVVVEEL